MRELRSRMQRLVFGLSSLFVILILALANGFAAWQASQTVRFTLDSASRLFNERGHDTEADILTQLPSCTVLLDRDGSVTGILARDPMMDEDEIHEAVTEGLQASGSFPWTAAWQSRREGSIVTIVDTRSVARHLQEVLAASCMLAAVILVLLWFGTRYLVMIMTRPIEENMQRQIQFTADASHELKTPLAVIMASAEAMEQDPQKKWLQAIITEADQMNHLITDLLDLSRSELAPVLESLDLTETVEQAALPFESLLYEKGLGLTLHLEPGLHTEGNAQDLSHLTGILIDNASRHADKDTDIDISLASQRDRIILTVTDIGDPIPAGEEEKIFSRFYRADASRNRKEGRYGLGLAIARNITDRHKGSIKAYSHDGRTVFEVSLPAAGHI